MDARSVKPALSTLRIVVPLLLILNVTGCAPDDGNTPSTPGSQLTAPGALRQTALAVMLDIQPDACPNRLNGHSQAVFSAVILGSDAFEVGDIDLATIALEGVAPMRTRVRDKFSVVCDSHGEDNDSKDSTDHNGRQAELDDGEKGGDQRSSMASTGDDDAGDGSSDQLSDKNESRGPGHHGCLCVFDGSDYGDVCTQTARRPDGFEDLSLVFRTGDIVAALDGYVPGSIITVTLTGSFSNGASFEASDCMRLVGMPPVETVSAPSQPTGREQSWPDIGNTYCTAGAASSEGHPLEYQFDFDAGGASDLSAWADSVCADHAWPDVGTFVMRARARCATHPERLSAWSEGLTVTVAEVTQLPQIHFATRITKIINGTGVTITRPYNPAALDTVGMFRPFAISYHGTTVNGMIRAYRFFSLTTGVDLEGENIWSTDLGDTLRVFPNRDDATVPSGIYRLGAQCRDDAGAESVVDAGRFTEGVCQIVVNYDPDTEVIGLLNTYSRGGVAFADTVDFKDSEPDTVPFNSWVTLFYQGWDSPYDSSLCTDPVNACLSYQVQYTRTGDINGGPANGGQVISSTIRWLPEDGEDNNPFGTPDSTSMTVGSETYDIRARTIDEYGKPDGTPSEVTVTGNFKPTLDDYSLVNYDGTIPADGDTLLWDYWNPANYNGSLTDTLDFSDPTMPEVVKEFYFVINANGHDSPKEQDGAGVKSWRYEFRLASDGTLARIARSGFWVDAVTTNALTDTIRLVRRYPYDPVDPSYWMEDLATLPGYVNTDLDFTVRGRDLGLSDAYDQFMYVDGAKLRLNSYNTSVLARWTALLGQRVHLAMKAE